MSLQQTPLVHAAASAADAASQPHDASSMTEDGWTYYAYVGLSLLPTYLFFKLWAWMGWELYVNN